MDKFFPVKNISWKSISQNSCLLLLGGMCFLYSLLSGDFAQVHIRVRFLEFPIFIGEIFLGICVLMFLLRASEITVGRRDYLRWGVAGFAAFFAVKTFTGYLTYGALALRHAAMFYYGMVAVISCNAFRRGFFADHPNKIILFLLLAVSYLSCIPDSYYLFTYLVCLMALVLSLRNKLARYFLSGALIFLSWGYFATSVRSILASILVSLLFLTGVIFIYFIKLKPAWKLACCGFVLVVIGLFIYRIGDKNALKSLVTFKEYFSEFRRCEAQITEVNREKNTVLLLPRDVVPEEIPSETKLYQDRTQPCVAQGSEAPVDSSGKSMDRAICLLEAKFGDIRRGVFPSRGKTKPDDSAGKENNVLVSPETVSAGEDSLSLSADKAAAVPASRAIESAQANLLWRVFVWRDMLREVVSDRAFLGEDFGKPFLSASVNALHWSDGAWVGWLEPHNSYIHMFYRAGVVGLLFILTIWGIFIRTAANFIRARNIKGVLLCSGILFWLVVSCFSVILELPYFAIPFWGLLGLAYAYSRQQESGIKDNKEAV